MAIPEHIRSNFETLLRAARNADLALIECTEALNGEVRYVVCAIGRDQDDYVFTPFGHMAVGNPFETYVPCS